MQTPKPDQIEVIAPNLKRRLSGVTATIVRLVPLQADDIGIVATGPGLPSSVPHVPLWRLPLLPRKRRVWHARRNTEMLLGLFLKSVLRMPLRLLFTSASQRKHTGYTKWLISKMDMVVATSSKTAGYLERPARVVLHGIDTQAFAPAVDRAALRQELRLSDGVLVGCYGRIRAQKGTDAFVDAMISILPGRPEVTALVMGRATESHGAFLEGLKAKVCDAGLDGRIRFLPEVTVDRMADWYRILDLYVAPQRWEGFGLTPVEAMACGVPVVATRVGAFEEIVTPQTGALVAPDDIPALADATAEFLDDPARRAAASGAARARAEESFRIEGEAAALIAIYREMLA
ncbi:glycosyltransferase family 4 protein [Sedimentimonas flavescens]|uniref:Glycosyltransferase family 4 protein n=1 Tax=Sedimentimonas flavescens TaxID=2851012 RepID=A0ABT3A2A9_9RHOB|nr:glycosyltransferase family 4 protein [Sedimentimonas flavescens]MCV2879977.1 glycosyltransferase family 4 protein [Sedimentimonas flavescens]